MPNRATLIRSLLALQSERRTGVLTINVGDTNLAVGAGGVRLVLCLRDGQVVFGTDTTPQKSLGRRLVQHGLLTEPLFAKIIASMPKTFGFEEPVRFCETAVQLGILTERSASKALDDESKQTVMRAVAPPNVEWQFEDAALDYLLSMIDLVRRPNPVNVEAAMHEAIRKLPMAQKLEAVEKVIDAMPIVLIGSPANIVARFELSPIEAKVVEALAMANEAPRAILERTRDPSLDPFALLAVLTITRIVRDAIAPASSRQMPAVSPASLGPSTPASPMMITGGSPSSARMAAAIPSTPSSARMPAAIPATPSSARIPAAVIVREEPISEPNRIEKKTIREAFEPVTLTPPQPSSAPPKPDRISLLVPDPPRSAQPARIPSSQSRIPISPPPASGPAISNRPTVKSGSPSASPHSGSLTPRAPLSSMEPHGSKPSVPIQRPTTDPFVPKARPSDVQMASRNSGVPPFRKTPPPSGREAAVMGEKLLTGAIEFVKVGRWAQAEPELARAKELLPESEQAYLYHLWTVIQLRHTPATKHERVDLARAAAAALKKDPDFAFAYYVVGDLSLNDDDVIQAQRLLSKAVKLDPTLLDAARLLRVVERRTKEPTKGGILGKKR